jgi:hypothetical protein
MKQKGEEERWMACNLNNSANKKTIPYTHPSETSLEVYMIKAN